MGMTDHALHMAAFNRRFAHAYRRQHQLFGDPPPELFHWHMREAIRWVQIAKIRRNFYGKAA